MMQTQKSFAMPRVTIFARSSAWLAISCLVVVAVLMTGFASSAKASEAISAFSTTTSTSQAGGHPDLETSFELEHPGAPESAQNVLFSAPQGIFGNTNAVTECTSADFALDQCPSNSQVGLVTIYANYEGQSKDLLGTAPIFDLAPSAEQTALFAFIVPTLNIPITIPVTVRTAGDYGLDFTVTDITQLTPLAAADLTFWGLPSSPTHNAQRFPKGAPGAPTGCPGVVGTSCLSGETPSSLPVDPLIDNPTACSSQPLTTSLEVQTYQDPADQSRAESSYPPVTGCEKETFKPLLVAGTTTAETDSASGLNLDLAAKQFEGFAVSPSSLKAVTVTLPPGFTINPDAADGQSACSDPEANFSSTGPAQCPDNSKIGTFSIGSPTLNGRLEGSVYIGEPEPGNQYRLFLTASGFGMNVKLVGSVLPDPVTGQLTAEFSNLPQVPFEDFALHLFAGERALMATPTSCTIYTVSANFVPWDGLLPSVGTAQIFGLESGPHGTACPGQIRPFTPSLEAGTAIPVAGAFSSFALKLNREDGDQGLGALNFTMPPGLTADLRGVSYCSDAQIAAAARTAGRVEQSEPSCPASSQIGTSNVAAGPGTHPFHAVGKIFFAGPFQGAPLSLVAITPALAGPYDYGTVVVRVALHIDPRDAHVIADSETVPEIIGGIPLRLREIAVNIDKPNFMINPTNCSAFSVGSEGIGDQGTAVRFSSPFRAVNCATLPFKPKMTVTQLGGHKQTRRSQDPSMRFELKTRAGDANVKSVAVTLPTAFAIDQRHLGNLCSKAELASDQCKGRQAIGTVAVESPLLEKPLSGPAYAVSGFGKLPHLAFILAGQVTLVPEAMSSSVKGGHLKTVVPVVPDAPIGRFTLTLYGAKQGYLTNTRELCTSPAVTTVEYTAQNGKKLTQRVKAKTACGAKSRKSKSHTLK